MARAQATDPVSLVAAYRNDLERYASECLAIVTKDAQLVRLRFNFAQRMVHARISEQMRREGRVRALILKARQEGVSTYCAARGYRRIHLYPNQNGLVIADQRKRSGALFGIYETFHRHLPEWIRPRKRYAQKATQLWYDMPTGGGLNSKLQVETASDVAAGRSTTIHYLHASEFAFWEHADEVYVALMQAVPDRGSEVIIESTANGVGNLFHQMWEAAEAGENGFLPIFLPWWIHEEYTYPAISDVTREEILATATEWERRALEEGIPWVPPEAIGGLEVLPSGATWNPDRGTWRLTVAQLAWRRATIRDKVQGDERMFRQEYPATAREAFLTSGNCFFDEDLLLAYEERCRPPQMRAELILVGDAIVPRPKPDGILRIWERPSTDCAYVIFGDTATGKQVSAVETSISGESSEKGGRDFSAAYVLCVVHRDYVAALHGRVPPEVFAQQLAMLGYLYSNPKPGSEAFRTPAYLGVERNHSSGETVIRLLREEYNYPNLHIHRPFLKRSRRITQEVGWVTTQQNRQVMLDQFSQALREWLLRIYDVDLIRECFTFVRAEDGRPAAQEGCHDDRVIAAAGAWQLALVYRPPSTVEPPPVEVTDTPTGWGRYT